MKNTVVVVVVVQEKEKKMKMCLFCSLTYKYVRVQAISVKSDKVGYDYN